MVALTATQAANFKGALGAAKTVAEAERLAFAIWSESGGLIYANDGANTSKSPGVTAAIKAKLRQSLNMPHDKVGSNGRSTGMLQQISSDVGGEWGSMAGTMEPRTSALRFLASPDFAVSTNRTYSGILLTPTGSKRVTVTLADPIAADVLRVQQPLADEAQSSNYGQAAVQIAKEIARQFFQPPTELSLAKTAVPAASYIGGLMHWENSNG